MKTVRLASIFATLLPSLIAAQTLPGQLPGQNLPGQLPGTPAKPATAAPPPAKPATAAPSPVKPATAAPPTAAAPAAAAARPLPSCCSITEINKAMGFVHAREKIGGRTIEIKASAAQMQNLQVGQDVFANLDTRKASLDGKTICCDLTIVPLPSAKTITGSLPTAGKIDKVSGLASEKIEVADFYYTFRRADGIEQIVRTGAFPNDNLGQSIKIYLELKNTSQATLSNMQWRIYKVSGPGQFDSGVQTISSLPSRGALLNVSWVLAEGSHRFVGVIDPNNQIAETVEMRANNTRTLDLTAGPLMSERNLDPGEAGAPGTLAANMQDSAGCKGYFYIELGGRVRVALVAPTPFPIPFPGCSMKPELYKDVQLKNGWKVQGVRYYPPPPSDTWSALKTPTVGGANLYGQLFLKIPSQSSPCGTGAWPPCRTMSSVLYEIRIHGLAAAKPF